MNKLTITDDFLRRRISRTGSKKEYHEYDREHKIYDVYKCKLCDKECKHISKRNLNSLYREVERHLEREHPDEFIRDPYENEEIFREWATNAGITISPPKKEKKPVIALLSETKVAKLHPDGTITLEISGVFSQGSRHGLALEGKRLVATDKDGSRSYISLNAFPIE